MNRKELEDKIREINKDLDVENVLKILEEKEQEINPAPKACFECPSLQRT
jgi:hypothetical protein